MAKNVAVLGTNGGTLFSPAFMGALNQIGENVGNSLFQFALSKRIANPKIFVSPHTSPSFVRDMAEILIIPAANQVNPAWDLGAWADFVEACDLPILCIGLGAQATMGAQEFGALKPGTERYIKAVAERSKTIGVRGKFTADILRQLGIHNTVVTGCPSQTINPMVSGKRIQKQIEEFATLKSPRIAHVFGTMEPETREAERTLSRLIAPTEHITVYQTEKRILHLIHTRQFMNPEDRAFLDWIRTQLRPDLGSEEYVSYILNSGRFFSDARNWIDAMASFDLVIGMRIHGAVAAIQSGRLGVCVAFDSRTLELAHTMGYPYVAAENMINSRSLKEILEGVIFDSARFDHLKIKNAELIDNIITAAGCLVDKN